MEILFEKSYKTPEDVSNNISFPRCSFSYSCSVAITNGIFANAQPDATVRSTFLQIIAVGAELCDLIEYIVYAPTLLPTPFGKTRIESFIEIL